MKTIIALSNITFNKKKIKKGDPFDPDEVKCSLPRLAKLLETGFLGWGEPTDKTSYTPIKNKTTSKRTPTKKA